MTIGKLSTFAASLIMTGLNCANAYAGGRGGEIFRPPLSGSDGANTASSKSMMTMMASLDPAQREQMLADCQRMVGELVQAADPESAAAIQSNHRR